MEGSIKTKDKSLIKRDYKMFLKNINFKEILFCKALRKAINDKLRNDK